MGLLLGAMTDNFFYSYGLFKSADKKLFKNDDLAAELGRPEKLVEMYVNDEKNSQSLVLIAFAGSS